jgi:hypothetical protein
MRVLIGRFFDNLGVFLAAVLTICGFLLFFMPWKQALSVKIVDRPKTSGEVFVNVAPDRPRSEKNHNVSGPP